MIVLIYGGMRQYAGGVGSFVPNSSQSLRMLIDELGCRFGDHFKELLLCGENCFFLINGRGIMATGGLDTPLSPGDRVEVMPFIDAG